MFRDPDQALSYLHDLAHRIHDNVKTERKYSEDPVLDLELRQTTAEFIEQFQWLDEHLSSHGVIPRDWYSAIHQPNRPRSSDA